MVTLSPGSIDTTGKVSPYTAPATYTVTNDYDAFSVHFSAAGSPTGIFFDDSDSPPQVLAWGGINASGVIDLVSPVRGRVVMPATGGAVGRTSQLSVEAGFAPTGNLVLGGVRTVPSRSPITRSQPTTTESVRTAARS